MPLPGELLIPEPDTDDNPPLFGSGFNFLNAPSAGWHECRVYGRNRNKK